MRMPRVHFTVRLMMIVVLVVALACGWVVRQLRRQALLAMSRTQMMVTNHFIAELPAGPNSQGNSHVVLREGSPGRFRWAWIYKAWSMSDCTRLIDVEALGGFDGSDLEPIVIKDHGGSQSARAIESMARIYSGREWRYDIMSRAPSLTPGASSEVLLRLSTRAVVSQQR